MCGEGGGVCGGGEVKWQFVSEYKSKFIMQSSLYNKCFAFGLFFLSTRVGELLWCDLMCRCRRPEPVWVHLNIPMTYRKQKGFKYNANETLPPTSECSRVGEESTMENGPSETCTSNVASVYTDNNSGYI